MAGGALASIEQSAYAAQPASEGCAPSSVLVATLIGIFQNAHRCEAD